MERWRRRHPVTLVSKKVGADPWSDIAAAVDRLKERRAACKAEAFRLKEIFERRYAELKAEHDALKVEISALEQVLEAHEARTAGPALAWPTASAPKALAAPRTPRPAGQPRADGKIYDRSSPDYIANIVLRWVREHDGQLVVNALADELVATERYPQKASARSAICSALANISRGFERVSRGVYRFYAIDGVALEVEETAAE